MKTYITVNEAAQIIKLKPSTIARYAKNGRLPAYRLKGTGQYYFVAEEIAESMKPTKNN